MSSPRQPRPQNLRRAHLLFAAATLPTLLPLTTRADSVAFNRQANGQVFTDSTTDGDGNTVSANYTWSNNAFWSQSDQYGPGPVSGQTLKLDTSNWSTPNPPTPDDDVLINGTAQLNTNASVQSLGISGELDLLGGNAVTISSGVFLNDGNTVVNWDLAAGSTALAFSASSIISGNGSITLNDDGVLAQIVQSGGTGILQIQPGQTVHGLGQINVQTTFDNQATIRADVPLGTLQISAPTTLNEGTLTATAGGTLLLSTNVANVGSISVDPNSTLTIDTGHGIANDPGTTLSVNGTLNLVGAGILGGTVDASSPGAAVNVYGASLLSGAALLLGAGNHLNITGSSTLEFTDANSSFTNNGTVTINSDLAQGSTNLLIDTDLSITGTGDINLNASGAYSVLSTTTGHTLTLGAGQTVHGAGNLTGSITNHGIVQADIADDAIVLSSSSIRNDNIIRANNHSSLDFTGSAVDNTGGTISATNFSAVSFAGATVTGGTFSTSAASFISWNGATLDGSPTLLGNHLITGGGSWTLKGPTLTNNGTITVNADHTPGSTALLVDSDLTLAGNGEVRLNAPGAYAQLNASLAHTLTLSSGLLVHGQGQLNGQFINQGQIIADVDNADLEITSPAFDNHGILRAANPGSSLIIDAALNNYATIDALPGASLSFFASTITNATPAANILLTGAALKLAGTTIIGGTVNLATAASSALVTNASTLQDTSFLIAAGAHLDIAGGTSLTTTGATTLTNNGAINVNADQAQGSTNFVIDNDLTLAGSGSVNLNLFSSYSQISTTPGHTLTIAAPQTIHGSGNVLGSIVNHGTITSDLPAGNIDLSGSTLTNTGTIQANNASTLTITSSTLDNTTGTLAATNASSLSLTGTTVTGGTISTSPDSSASWNNATLTGPATLAGNHNLSGGSVWTLNGPTLTNNGKITVNADQALGSTTLSVDADLTLNGTGQILLNLNSSYAQLNVINAHTLTLGPAQLLHGQGQINGTLINQGITRADVAANPLEITGPLTNAGTLAATGGATLLLDPNSLTNLSAGTLTGGTYQADANSTLSTTDPISTNAANIVLNGPGAKFDSLAANLASNTSSFTITGGATFTAPGSLTNSGVIAVGAASTLSLPAGNYTQTAGATILNGGTLSTAPANAFLINAGTLVGNGTVAANATIAGTLIPAGNSSIEGTLAFAKSLTLTSSAQTLMDVTNPTTLDQITVANTATLNGTLAVTLGYTPSPTTSLTLLTASSVTGSFTNHRVGATATSSGLLIGYTPTAVTLGSYNQVHYLPNADGYWIPASNWDTNSTLPKSSDDVIIDIDGPTVRTVTLSVGAQSIHSLTSNENLTLSGGSLSLANDSTLNGNLFLASATLTGAGNLTLNGPANTFASGFMTGTGKTILSPAASLNLRTDVPPTLSRTLENNGVVNVTGPLTHGGPVSITFAGGTFNNLATTNFTTATDLLLADSAGTNAFNNAGTLTKSANTTLTIQIPFTNTGLVDLQAGKIVLNQSPATLLAQLHTAYNNGAWTGATGITSSTAAADPNHLTAIAYSLTGTNTYTLQLTEFGDANLDGKIDADDYALLDRSFAQNTPNPHWTDGDFNYDGIINNQDYLLIDQALYRQTQGFSPGFLPQRESQLGAQYVSQLLASLPEPSSLLACSFALPTLRPRRKVGKKWSKPNDF